MKKIKLTVSGMHCPSCEMLIKDNLEENNAVKNAEVSHEKGTVIANYDEKKIDEDTIKNIIRSEGYGVK